MKLVMAASIFVCLVGCATGYQPKGYSGGYEDFELGGGKILVEFYGNGYTHRSDVQRMAIKRANEACEERGYQGHEIVNLDQDRDAQIQLTNGQIDTVNRVTSRVMVQCKGELKSP